MRFWATVHHSISIKILYLTHWNVSDTVNKFQLCTSNLKFQLMNKKMYIATWDTQIVLKTKRYSHYEIKILNKDASFNIDEYSVRNTLKCGWYVQQISALYILLNRSNSWIKLYILLHEIRKYFLRQSHIDVEKSRFWQRIHHSILMKMLSLTHWNVSDNGPQISALYI